MTRLCNEKLLWSEWSPGLDNDDLTLKYVLGTMPGVDAVEIPLIIRLFENPSSMIAFPGAISLERHDAMHVILGRGLMIQDEAFVIGYTMGSHKKLKDWHISMFSLIARNLYKHPYNFKRSDMIPFRLGIWEGRYQECQNLNEFPFEDYLDWKLCDLRKKLKVDRQRLYSIFTYEKSLLPDTRASKRLDIDFKKLDPSSLAPP